MVSSISANKQPLLVLGKIFWGLILYLCIILTIEEQGKDAREGFSVSFYPFVLLVWAHMHCML